MDMTGQYRIAAPRQKVWTALNDPEVLKQCIPGCEALEKTSDTEFAATVQAKVGPVRSKFGGTVHLSNIEAPRSYTISGEGKGGAAGFAKGSADVALEEDGDGTLLRYEVKATVGGKLAQIGSRLVDSTARKMADDFFSRFKALLEPEAGAAEPAGEAGAPAAEEGAQPRRVVKPAIWIAALIIIVALLLLYFAGGG